MKTMSFKFLIPLTTMSFLFAYILKLSVVYWEQFFALTTIILVDGLFGIMAGIKREGFKTFKALKIFKTLFVWVIILASILITEKAFPFASWLSETFILPVIVFYLISAIKNATSSGFIKSELMKQIMSKIDQHKNKAE